MSDSLDWPDNLRLDGSQLVWTQLTQNGAIRWVAAAGEDINLIMNSTSASAVPPGWRREALPREPTPYEQTMIEMASRLSEDLGF